MIEDSLSEKSRKEWTEIYERLTGKKWRPKRKKDIDYSELEGLPEITKLMADRPNPTRRE